MKEDFTREERDSYDIPYDDIYHKLMEERTKLENNKYQLRERIDWSLNRISLTNDDYERDGQVGQIVNYIIKYRDLSIQSDKLLNEIANHILVKRY